MFGSNLKPIIEGHINELLNKEQELSFSRLKICQECPLYTESAFGPICDGKKCWNQKENEVQSYPTPSTICGCGCRLTAKTTLKNAHCVLNKW